MRILVVTNMYPTSESPIYGRFVAEQVEDVRNLGIGVDVMFIDGRREWTNYVRAISEIRQRLASGAHDLVHAHYGLCGAVALAQRHAPVVTTFHGADTYIPWQGSISWFVARLTTAVFVSSRAAADLSLPNAPVIPCGVDIELFRPLPRIQAIRALGWDERRRHILFPGRRTDAAKRYELFEQVITLAAESRPDLESVALGDFPREKLPLVMNASDATVMTSIKEGSPIAIRESLACMTPVVSVPVGDVEKVLSGLPGCFVAAPDPARLAARLLDALQVGKHRPLRQRAETHSRTRTAARLATIYESVTNDCSYGHPSSVA